MLSAATIKFIEENTGQKPHGTRFGNDFLDRISKGQATEHNEMKLDFSKVRSVCVSQDTVNSDVKRQPTEQEEVFANHVSEKGEHQQHRGFPLTLHVCLRLRYHHGG